MEINEITKKLGEFEQEMLELRKENRRLREQKSNLEDFVREQQSKLSHIYESSAQAQYDAVLWQKRYERIEDFIAFKLELTPASAPYMRVMLELKELKKRELHELYQNSTRG
ncbi:MULTISPECIES: hypothetical protein [Staphylococcus]|uniref:hypothetical protein n=1 Tax=Staphylococcus TaxID=1279 RepID=UPI000E0688C2|nr:hypothetical protein [Staphylococcus nepalensis]SUM66735.1 Uncharacterised protein [Staphylococcus nepalensis]SUM94672.1 Uncharacterised protein [Staphylococcus nepalensis]